MEELEMTRISVAQFIEQNSILWDEKISVWHNEGNTLAYVGSVESFIDYHPMKEKIVHQVRFTNDGISVKIFD